MPVLWGRAQGSRGAASSQQKDAAGDIVKGETPSTSDVQKGTANHTQLMADACPTLLRGAGPADIPLIKDSWLNSFRHSYHVRGVDNQVYYQEHRRIVDELLLRGTTLVMCDATSPSVVFAWMTCEMLNNWMVIHFMFVKGAFQDWGLGTKLVEEVANKEPHMRGIVYTHMTKAGRKWAQKMAERAPLDPHRDDGARMPVVYNPYLLYQSLEWT